MKEYKIGLIGAGFMSKAHVAGYDGLPTLFADMQVKPVKWFIADVAADTAAAAAKRFGFQKSTGDWRDVVADPEVDIIDIATPNDSHAEIAIAAARAGKHVMCEKPMAMNVEQARAMYEAVQAARVKSIVAYNYRRVPAIAFMKQLVQEGAIGKVLNFRGEYLQDWSASPQSPLSWRFKKEICGTGALGDIATHAIDLSRYILGDEIDELTAMLQTYIKQRPIQTSGVDSLGKSRADTSEMGEVKVDDEVMMLVRYRKGTVGSFEATRNAWGRNNFIRLELHGTEGSMLFDYDSRDSFELYLASDPDTQRGFKRIFTGPFHPYGSGSWNLAGMGLGYTDVKINDMYDLFRTIEKDEDIGPDFKDGYNMDLVVDAVERSARSGRWEKTNCI